MRVQLLACLVVLLGGPSHLSGQITLVGSAIHERQAAPGTGYEGTLVVHNPTAEPQQARLYQTDYHFFADGRSLYEEHGSTPRSNAPWVTVSPTRVAIPAGETVQIHYRVSVPATADGSLHGTYWSMIMVEGIAGAAAGEAAPAGEMAVRPTIRYGVQVVTHIEGTGAARVGFGEPSAGTASDAGRWLEVDLTNVGDRAHRIDVTLELYTEDGKPAGTLRSARGLVYPGTSIRQRFALGPLPGGTYRALLVADAGADAVFGAQYSLRF